MVFPEPAFNGDRVLGAILFEVTLDGFVERIEGVSDIDDLAQVLGDIVGRTVPRASFCSLRLRFIVVSMICGSA